MGPANTTAANATATGPAQSLMYQRQSAGSHSTRKHGNATQSAFSDYGFGPADTGDRAKNSVQPVSGSFAQAVQQSMPWVAQVQASGTK